MNGPPAHLFQPGDLVIVLSLGLFSEKEMDQLKPSVVFVDENNRITEVEHHELVIFRQDAELEEES